MLLDIVITIIILFLIICIWIILYDCNHFVVRKLTVADKRIRKSARAVVIADLHNKRYGKQNEILLEAIRKQKPDFILIAGDLITAAPGKKTDPAVSFLKELVGEYPIYYGNGNHEHRIKLYPETYGEMATEYEHALGKLHIEPLVNCHVTLPDIGIDIYGSEIDRKYYKKFRVKKPDDAYLKKILGKPDSNNYSVLLAHNPQYFKAYAEWGADLTISGHVHGGIARVPFWGKGVISPSLRLFPQYDGGIFYEGHSTMLLSRGLGTHTIPLRFHNPGELWVVDFEHTD